VPINKDPLAVINNTNCLVENGSKRVVDVEELRQELGEDAIQVLNLDLKKEMEWLLDNMSKIESRVVFGHFDYHTNNIMLGADSIDEPNIVDSLRVVDLEMCGYFYRGYDFATHFIMAGFDLETEGHPGLVRVHSEEKKRFFIREYLKEWEKMNPITFDPTIDSEDNILRESYLFSVLRYVVMFIVVKLHFAVKGHFRSKDSLESVLKMMALNEEAKKAFNNFL
jgi:thiamine kinase-like enzyme